MPTQTGSFDCRGIRQSYESVEVGGRNLLPLTGVSTGYHVNTIPSGTNPTRYTDGSFYTEVTKTYANIPFSSNVAIEDAVSGTEYTLSLWVKSTASREYYLQVRINNNGADGGSFVNGRTTAIDANTWTKLVCTFTASSSNSVYMRLYQGAGTACTVYVKEWKFEKGTKATDWSPAPEDVLDKSVPIYCRTNSSNTPTALPTVIITNTSDTGTTAPSTNGNGWTKRHMTRVYASNLAYKYLYTCNQLISVGGYLLGHTDVVPDEGTVSIDGGDIVAGTVTADQMAANSITVGNMSSETQSQVLNSNIQVGGRNLLILTGTDKGYYTAGTPSGTNLSVDTDGSFYKSVTSTSATIACASCIATEDVISGETYTASIWLKSSIATRRVTLQARKTSSGDDGGKLVESNWFYLTADTWEKLTYTFTASASTSVFLRVYIEAGDACKVNVKEWKFEKGNKNTDWTPAPEDTVNENLLLDSQKMGAWACASAAAVDTTDEYGVATLNGSSSNWNANVNSRPTIKTSTCTSLPMNLLPTSM